jgi:NAD(P)-dependent dehydrogenase (short-subunit alcohol dehydrogenase family)
LRALVIGASGGIGGALASAFAEAGAEVTTLSRQTDGFELTEEASIAEAASKLAGHSFDRIVVATGALTIDGVPPETAFSRLTQDAMARSFAINASGPAMVIKHFAPLLPRKTPSVFAVLSARLASVGDNQLGGWMSYRAAKSALNQILRCAAIEYARKRPQAVMLALHPGTVPTAMTAPYARNRYTASPDEAAAQLISVMDGGAPAETGSFFAYDGSTIPW